MTATPNPPELVEQVRQLWLQGYSAYRIESELDGRLSKNAVCGIVYRGRERDGVEMWPIRRATLKKPPVRPSFDTRSGSGVPPEPRGEPKTRKGYPVPWKAKPLPAVLPAPPTAMSVNFVERGLTQCSYPTGDDKPGPEMVCCGAPVVDNSSWCGYHQPLVFPPRGR